jgi:hypothetical protein
VAADKKMNIKDFEAQYAKQNKFLKEEIEMLKEQKNALNTIFDYKRKNAIQSEIDAKNQQTVKQIQDAYLKALNDGVKFTKQQEDAIKRRINNQKTSVGLIKNENDGIDRGNRLFSKRNELMNNSLKITKSIWEYSMQSDKIIRQTILSLGMSGNKAEFMRASFEDSAKYVTSLGGSLSDILEIQTGYANETGRARVLTADMVNSIELIAKGTNLGVEAATRLGAQFEIMGYDARSTMEYVQGVVDTSERMGVNTVKVLKNVSDNFKKLNTYTFQQGIKGMAQMAQYAEKMNIDINSALNSADIAKSLEGAIDLAANLQVMGGEFAKSDPFELLFLSRNDPAKFSEKINQMTKGVVTFRKMADGSFEKFISPADRDRLANVAKSLGISTEEITQQSLRMADIQKMRQEMVGSGLSAKDKQIVEGMAIFNTGIGKFQVQIGNQIKNLSDLSSTDEKLLRQQSVSLEQRAKAAQDFETVLKITIEELKATALPLLRGVNKVLEVIRPILEGFTKVISDMSKSPFGNILLKGAGVMLAATAGLNFFLEKLTSKGIGDIFSGVGKRNTRTIGGNTAQSISGGRTKNLAGAGKSALGKGVGVGVAGAGIGAGVMMASEGISHLADSMSKLDKTQIWALPVTITALAAAFAAFTIPLAILGPTLTASSVGLLAFGGTALMIGAGVGIAAAGIGYMADGLGNLLEKSKGAKGNLFSTATGIAAIAGSLAVFSNPLTLAGMAGFSLVMGTMTAASLGIALAATKMEKMGVAMKGTKDDWMAIKKAIDSISNANFDNLKQLRKLGDAFNKPIKVEFSDKQVAIVSDITLNIDGDKFMERIYKAKKAVVMENDVRSGKRQ